MDLYDKIILWAAGAGIVTMLMCLMMRKKLIKQRLILLPGMAISLVLGFMVSVGVDVMIMPYFEFADVQLFPPNCGNQFLITMLAFYGFYALYTLIVRQPFAKSMDLPVVPLIVFALVSRFACVWAGCCNGVTFFQDVAFPCVWLEIIFAAIFFILSIKNTRGCAYRYLQSYCVFRVIMEALRVPTGVATVGVMSVNMVVALLVGAVLAIVKGMGIFKNEKVGNHQMPTRR